MSNPKVSFSKFSVRGINYRTRYAAFGFTGSDVHISTINVGEQRVMDLISGDELLKRPKIMIEMYSGGLPREDYYYPGEIKSGSIQVISNLNDLEIHINRQILPESVRCLESDLTTLYGEGLTGTPQEKNFTYHAPLLNFDGVVNYACLMVGAFEQNENEHYYASNYDRIYKVKMPVFAMKYIFTMIPEEHALRISQLSWQLNHMTYQDSGSMQISAYAKFPISLSDKIINKFSRELDILDRYLVR